MAQKSVWEMTLVERQAAGVGHYSPWWLALSVSGAWALLIVLTLAAYFTGGALIGGLVGALLSPTPLFVTAWSFKAWEVESERMAQARALVASPADSGDADREEPTPVVELTAGYSLQGEIVAPMRELTPEAAALRDVCLRFVRGGMRRGGWSRSRLAEGEGKWMSGDDWSKASKELQRLGFFAPGPEGLRPARDVGDVLRRLEAAR